MTSLYPILIFLVPFGGALLCAIVGWWWVRAARLIALTTLGLMTGLALAAGGKVLATGSLHTHLGGWAPPLGIEFVMDPLTVLMAVLVSGGAFLLLLGMRTAVSTELEGRETAFHALTLLLVTGMTGMVMTGDLFNMFVHLEVTSLSAYALAGSGRPGAARAGLHYLLIGSLGASLYLLGVGFIYAGTGTLNMADVAVRLADAPPQLAMMGAALIAGGLGIKMALFPLHGWMPAAYSACTTPAATLMAALVTKVAAYALLRILVWVYGASWFAGDLSLLLGALGWAGAVAMVAAGVLAFAQNDLRRMLAYSSVSQMGLIAIGISLANRDGLTGAILHITSDALMKGALVLAASAAFTRFGISRIDQLGALRGRAPWTIAAIAVAGISLIGLPPLAGFFGKWYVLMGAIEAQRWGFVVAIVAGTLATAAYVFRIMEPLLFASGAPASAASADPRPPRTVPQAGPAIAAAGFALALLLLGLFNAPLVSALVRAALPEGF